MTKREVKVGQKYYVPLYVAQDCDRVQSDPTALLRHLREDGNDYDGMVIVEGTITKIAKVKLTLEDAVKKRKSNISKLKVKRRR